MRRGRPVRHSKTDSASEQPQQQPQHNTFDPFDPSYIGASTTAIRTSTTGLSGQHKQSSSADIDDAFALNEQNLKAIEKDQQKVRNSMTFDSDFQPIQPPKSSDTSATVTSTPSSPESSKRNNHKSLSNHLSGKSSNVKPLQNQLFDHLMDDNDNKSPAWQQQKSLSKIDSSSISDNNIRKSNQQQPSRAHVSSSFTKNSDVSPSVTTSTTNKTDELPVLRNNVSSSIEARLNALKMSVEGAPRSTTPLPSITNGSPVTVISSVSSSLKPSRSSTNKPAPPPKPARFRVAQNRTSSSAQKSLTGSSTTTAATAETETEPAAPQPAPIKPSRSTTMDVSDFESKFPSIEELYKQLPVAAATALGSNEPK